MGRWYLGLPVLRGGALWLFLWILSGAQSVAAQIVPDDTLPIGERSQVSGNPNFEINGGARRGNNLFHSFSQFSVPTGGSAFFNNAADVQNIFSRVTGGFASNIDGLIQANGDANLFLLNPNGIIFEPDASLNIGGSFFASTADRFQFESGFAFSASNPQPPPLLTVTVPIGLQYGSNPGSIQVQEAGLDVAFGQTLALLGGTVSINGGQLLAPEGYIELAGVAAEGRLDLNASGSSLRLSFPDAVGRVDIDLDQQAELNVRGEVGGNIAINARTINIAGGSRVRAGLVIGAGTLGVGTSQSQAGDIELTATTAVRVTESSILANNTGGLGNAGAVRISAPDVVAFEQASQIQSGIAPGAVGDTGGIMINTGSFYLNSGAALNSVNAGGQGNPGDIVIRASDSVALNSPEDPTAPLALVSFIRSGVTNGEGNGGNINITTGSLSIRNGSTLFSGLAGGAGNAGSININAPDVVTIAGGNRADQASGIRSSIFNGEGNSGNISIVTGSLLVTDGGVLNTNVQSLAGGSAGNITINARDAVSFEGTNPAGFQSLALSNVASLLGNGGDITITARSLSVLNGAQLTAVTSGAGNAGSITASADTVSVIDGQLFTTTFGSGRAGDIVVNTPDLQLGGETGGLFAETTSDGDAGNLTIQPLRNGQNARVNVQDGAQISASTSGSGQGGRLTITAPESIALTGNGSTITAGTEGSGRGGDLALQTNTLDIQDQAEVTVSSSSTGRAGSLFVDANKIVLNRQGSIRADTTGGGGDINLRSPQILLRNGSDITTNASGGNIPGGNVAIDTQFLVAVPTEDSDISANSEDFRGGNVDVNALATFGLQPRLGLTPLSDITATGASLALNGAIAITTPRTDPTTGLVELPTDLADASQQIAQGCSANQGNSFVASGRGGLPPTPAQQLDDDAGWQDRRRLSAEVQLDTAQPTTDSQWRSLPSNPSTASPLIEATGWQTTPTGAIQLVAAAANSAPLNQSVACQGNR